MSQKAKKKYSTFIFWNLLKSGNGDLKLGLNFGVSLEKYWGTDFFLLFKKRPFLVKNAIIFFLLDIYE